MSLIDPQTHQLRSGHDLIIRCPVVADAPQLCRYLEAIWDDPGHFNVTGPDEVSLTPEQEGAWVQAHLEAPTQLALVAEVAGEIVGLLNSDAPPRQRLAHTAELGISIAAGWREQGIGRLLIAAALAWAQAHPRLEKVWLTVGVRPMPAPFTSIRPSASARRAVHSVRSSSRMARMPICSICSIGSSRLAEAYAVVRSDVSRHACTDPSVLLSALGC
jgi:RimJ/RimL family protein N-acetyltransferase